MRILAHTLKRLTNLAWLNLFEIQYENAPGAPATWQFVSRKAAPVPGTAPLQPDAVFIVPLLKAPSGYRLAAVREFRVPLGDYEVSFPAGLVEPGETIETTARRELAEETGLTLSRILSASPPVVSTAGMSDESAVIVFVECAGDPGAAAAESSEEIEVLVLDFAALLALLASPAKFSAKAWLVLKMFEARGAIEPITK
jgi:ADP-ribose pyrophosphatase